MLTSGSMMRECLGETGPALKTQRGLEGAATKEGGGGKGERAMLAMSSHPKVGR